MADKPEQKSGLSLQTLLISAAAAVIAATVVPMFWEQGTIFATAMTPVVVALVSEALRKPVETVSSVAPRVTRRTGTGAALRRADPVAARAGAPERVGARGEGPERFEPLPEHRRHEAPAVRSDDPFGLRDAQRRPRRHWKIAALTGLLAFVIAGAFITVTELATGGSVSTDRKTSLFGGQKDSSRSSDREKDAEATPTATPGEEAVTPTPEAGETPAPTPTPTVTPEATATPVPTQAAPAPTTAP